MRLSVHGLQAGDEGYTQRGCLGRLTSATGPVPASLGSGRPRSRLPTSAPGAAFISDQGCWEQDDDRLAARLGPWRRYAPVFTVNQSLAAPERTAFKAQTDLLAKVELVAVRQLGRRVRLRLNAALSGS
jgi:hypothetical protein